MLQADLTGVIPDDIELRAAKRLWLLSGEKQRGGKQDTNGASNGKHVASKFDRRFSLPETADIESIPGTCRNGLLEITIPEFPDPAQRRITVDIA